ncbi:MAG TPA: YciI family protein [Euzebyales bacterium]|nr:YciI family protein [Euzebyales bacterium]
MAQYTLLIYSDVKRWQEIGEDEMDAINGEYFAITQAMRDAGVHKGGAALQDVTTARTVAADGVVTDGPFADITEHLGGFYLLELDSADQAVQWAARLPGVARGIDRIEVRPVMEYPEA